MTGATLVPQPPPMDPTNATTDDEPQPAAPAAASALDDSDDSDVERELFGLTAGGLAGAEDVVVDGEKGEGKEREEARYAWLERLVAESAGVSKGVGMLGVCMQGVGDWGVASAVRWVDSGNWAELRCHRPTNHHTHTHRRRRWKRRRSAWPGWGPGPWRSRGSCWAAISRRRCSRWVYEGFLGHLDSISFSRVNRPGRR